MSSSDKALNAILPLIAAGQAYEAHQKARTFASRYMKANAYDTAIQVLFQSARELLKNGHAGSGTDLGAFLIEVYYAKEQEVDNTSRGRSSYLFENLEVYSHWVGILTQLIALTGSQGAWRKTLIDKAVAYVVRLPSK
jgi:golgi to ER traffic protein 4